ncbi:MAG: BrnA antitoxin family protein [Rhodanobacter sp.]|jgi:uncharacterized protein (DUF4415 family)|nr:BrnA antitoxin family protein [Rhodanobacter sp.]
MNGLSVNKMTRKQVAKAVRAIPVSEDFVWDGENEDERPLTKEEMRAGIERAKKRGRPIGSSKAAPKVQTAIRFDPDVLAALRATGRGWQTRVNEVMREWAAHRT